MRRHVLVCIVIAGLNPASLAYGQTGETAIFGSLQTVLFHQKSRVTYGLPQADGPSVFRGERSSFAVQQLDIFLQKPIGEHFSAFVDLEYQLNYSSDKKWGSLSLQEAWLNYDPIDEVNLKVGMLYPAFNNLNEIKNRLALLPYIFRPGVYERLLSDIYMSEDYLPEHAFVQISGLLPHGDIFWEYALYVGNAESSYISRHGTDGKQVNDLNQNFEFLTGVDPTEFNMKLFGGRLGIRARNENFKAGFSLTHDYDNFRDTTRYPPIYSGIRTPLIGDAPRFRIGADLSGSVGNVRFESEFIRVLYDYRTADLLGIDLDHVFYYTMLGYQFSDRLFVYGRYEGGEDVFDVTSSSHTISGGAAFQLNTSITAKAQYIIYENTYGHLSHEEELLIRFVFLGFSIVL